jgi:hypothetical protein
MNDSENMPAHRLVRIGVKAASKKRRLYLGCGLDQTRILVSHITDPP